jgi:uncharacterized protein with HEPN domain
MTQEEFIRDRKTYWSTVKMIEIIGEAARHIPDEVQTLMPDVEWQRIIGVRNVFVHGYFGITSDVLWDIVETSVPRLRGQIGTFIEANREGEW